MSAALQKVQHALERTTGAPGRRSSRNPYTRAAGAAAAVLTLAGLGIGLYVYSRWTPDSQPGQGGDDWAAGGRSRRSGGGDDETRATTSEDKEGASAQQPPKSAAPATGATQQARRRRLPRPSLSLSLPPTFDRSSPQALQLLHDLVAALAEHFLIHLILPDSPSSSSNSTSESPSPATAATATGQNTGALAAVFADVLDFDTRRLLLYGTPAGRQALGLALACDAHVEISLVGVVADPKEEEGGSSSSDGNPPEESIKKVEHLQRTAGVVVLCVLPAPGRRQGQGEASVSPATSASRANLDAVLEHFKKASFSRSVRIIDTSTPSAAEGPAATGAQSDETQWRTGAARIVELRAKMK
ncbi:unnamed protein product [Tilletia controversa]|uniref:Peroxisome assembly protein 22 n=3 Tax=Tilletia TaxID=13289 RepID=A0A8X7SZ87_9BASI|nr:hypothetical protein CF336_g3619 [Tilletia laevis]KAE8199279.1 hypothetical protein CF328_g3298 [Tilletia controversa]KAE8261789.1 hypothetical protein A4X03_0g2970 [Tilletia caries]KAE8204052.1 hypothetical protein CF335_g2793 [Tilletia laevis]KAE8252286.1 hypothetical protein A4X06_0g2299 [Tilletia controversa]